MNAVHGLMIASAGLGFFFGVFIVILITVLYMERSGEIDQR